MSNLLWSFDSPNSWESAAPFTYVAALDCVALVLVGILFFRMRQKKRFFTLDEKLFTLVLVSVFAALFADMMSYVFIRVGSAGAESSNIINLGVPYFEGARVLSRIFNGLLFMLMPLMAITWGIYVDYKIFGDEKRLKTKVIPAYFVIFAINAILSIVSMFVDVYFTIDSQGYYT